MRKKISELSPGRHYWWRRPFIGIMALMLTFLAVFGSFGRDDLKTALAATGDRSRPFLNTNPPAYNGPSKSVFKILEIIPHDAASYFPYMIDWKTEQGYNDNVPIGYEGLLAAATAGGSIMYPEEWPPWGKISAGYGNPTANINGMLNASHPLRMLYTPTSGVDETTYFTDYETYNAPKSPGGTAYNQANIGKWYRYTGAAGLTVASGYFEYVGAQNGLYYISTSYPDAFNSKIATAARKGAEQPRGEFYVAQPAYYLAREHETAAKPQYPVAAVLTDIASWTGFNYDLIFSPSPTGLYRADFTRVKDLNEAGAGHEYLVAPEGDPAAVNLWRGGYGYLKSGGNFTVENADEITGTTGAYVRVADDDNDDGLSAVLDLPKGYFRKYQPGLDIALLTTYDVTFAAADQVTGQGFYYALSPDDWWEAGCAFSFVHYQSVPGAKSGAYDVPFIYGDIKDNQGQIAETAKYDYDLRQLTEGTGRYALTSTASETVGNAKIPVYSNAGANTWPKDYNKEIINIDFINQVQIGKGTDWYNQRGVTLGGGDYQLTTEYGGWVFRPVDNTNEMGTTKVSAVTASNGKFAIGDKIWVYNQQYRVRYYARNGFRNNELFKLLIYSLNPADPAGEISFGKNINGVGYNWNETPLWNLKYNQDAINLINDFDSSTRIEIIQRSFDQVTAADINSANLIYIARSCGLEGMTMEKWNDFCEISEQNGGPPITRINGAEVEIRNNVLTFKLNGDISSAALFALYRRCIYEQSAALMIEYDNFASDNNGSTPDTNLEKLIFLMFAFDNGQTFKYFIDRYPEKVDYFSTIYPNDSRTGVKPYGSPAVYNVKDNVANEEQQVRWLPAYFKAALPSGQLVARNNLAYRSSTNIDPDQTIMALRDYGPNALFLGLAGGGNFNIFQILRNSLKNAGYNLLLRPTAASKVKSILNPDGTVKEYVLYCNEFDADSFTIEFEGIKDLTNPPEVMELATVSCKIEGGADSQGVLSNVANKTFSINVRADFLTNPDDPNAQLDLSQLSRTYLINGTDVNGMAGTELKVTVIVRDSFNLN